jgi:DNA/RNA endonuclease YhcR with UshA esterase domain
MRRAADLSASDIGDLVLLEAAVTEIEPFSAGVKAVLDDGSGSVVLLLWQDLYESLDQRASLVEGAIVRVQGKVNGYRGRLEIVPEVPSDVSVSAVPGEQNIEPRTGEVGGGEGVPTSASHVALLSTAVFTVETSPATGSVPLIPQTTVTVDPASSTPTASPMPTATYTPIPAPTPTHSPTIVPSRTPLPTIEVRSIGDISQGDVGTTISIGQATISELDYFSAGVKYTLTDTAGSITLLLWQNVIEEIPARYDLVPGSQVSVVGEINDYEGDLEIIPGQGSDVAVLLPGDRLPIEERTADDVTPADERRIFSVEGVVVRTESNGWLKLWLGDGTGNVLVFVPQRTVPHLPLGIGGGVRLRVTGEVDIYQGVVEIIPLAGADVEVR